MSNLCNEVRSTFLKDKYITSARCAQMKYLNAVIEESLRMYPPLVTELPRVVPKDGGNVDEYSVPANVIVSTHHYSSYHAPTNSFLAEQFILERWPGIDARISNDKRDVLQPFSLEPRGCLGKNKTPISFKKIGSLAYLEIRLILTKLVCNFDMEICKESEN
ncbi:hypothetical protein N7507_004368 [Penicillium longicatenatum]|nr:hypothetical protein N7507_004368 [Penicillium longicatenatum]